MTIARILRDKHDRGAGAVVHIPPELRVAELTVLLSERGIGAVPVCDAGKVVGIISERDIVHALGREGGAVLDRPVERMMTRDPVMVTPDTPLLAGLSLMTRRRIRHLPVVEGERMVGFVSIGDLVKARIDRIESEADAMRTYITG